MRRVAQEFYPLFETFEINRRDTYICGFRFDICLQYFTSGFAPRRELTREQ